MWNIKDRRRGMDSRRGIAPIVEVMESRCLLAGNPTITALQGVVVAPGGGSIPRTPDLHDYDRISATVDWGDGSGVQAIEPFLDRIYAQDDSSFAIDLFGNGHAYASPGAYTIHLAYTLANGSKGTVDWDVTVRHFDLIGVTQEVKTGEDASSATLAYIETNGQDFDPADFTATIDWKDGSAPTNGTITRQVIPGPGLGDIPRVILGVSGSHVYAESGIHFFSVTMTDAAGESHTWSGIVVVKDDLPPVTPPAPPANAIGGVQNTLIGPSLGRMVKAPWMTSYGQYPVTVDWGDGTPPESGIALLVVPNGTDGSVVEVSLMTFTHLYAHGGTYAVSATIAGPSGESAAVTATATIDHFQAYGQPLNATTGTPIGPDPVAYVVTPGEVPAPAEFSATIDWGDGSAVEAGVLVLSTIPTAPGIPARLGLVLANTHTFAGAGIYPITVTVTDARGESHVVHQYAFVAAGSAGGVVGGSAGGSAGLSAGGSAGLAPGGPLGLTATPGQKGGVQGNGRKATAAEISRKIKAAKAQAARKRLEAARAARRQLAHARAIARHERLLAARYAAKKPASVAKG